MDITYKNYIAKADKTNGRYDLYRIEKKVNKEGQERDAEILIGYSYHIETLPKAIATDMIVQNEGSKPINEAFDLLKDLIADVKKEIG